MRENSSGVEHKALGRELRLQARLILKVAQDSFGLRGHRRALLQPMKQSAASGSARGASVVLGVVASLDGLDKSPRGLTGESPDAPLFPRRGFRGRHGGE
eukprot:8735214-Pyramimonas_sp.AAC.1